MSAPFQPGDVVVCVDDRPWGIWPDADAAVARLRRWHSYRVLATGEDYLGNVGINIGVPNSDIYAGFNDIWPPRRFRKIDEEQYPEILERLKSLSKPKERTEA